MAETIGIYTGYAALSFLPPLIWLLFYLHEDRHPEPKHLVLITFAAGILGAVAAVAVEISVLSEPPHFSGLLHFVYPEVLKYQIFILAGVGFIEEFFKYAAVRITVLSRPEFDEPVDAMIYMVTAALGFAAIENIVFLVPVFEESLIGGFELTATRFLGANLLHALSSAIVGYFIARHMFSPWRKHAIAAGIIIAGILHTFFNYFIITREDVPESLALLILLLVLMAVAVFVEFERLKGWRPANGAREGQNPPRKI